MMRESLFKTENSTEQEYTASVTCGSISAVTICDGGYNYGVETMTEENEFSVIKELTLRKEGFLKQIYDNEKIIKDQKEEIEDANRKHGRSKEEQKKENESLNRKIKIIDESIETIKSVSKLKN